MSKSDLEELSYLCMENGSDYILECKADDAVIDSVEKLIKNLDKIFNHCKCPKKRYETLMDILRSVDLSTTEINKYTFFDYEKPYTRNLIATDGKHYSLLLLCWSPGKESKIHNHPCDYCFVKTIRGCVRETKYSVHESTKEIRHASTRFFCEGQVSYMNDDIGLHKIGNPNQDTGSVSLHLYTPPFVACKVWPEHGVDSLEKWEDGKIGFFSVMGHRSPHLEGKPGNHNKLMQEIRNTIALKSPLKGKETSENWNGETKELPEEMG